MASEFTASAEQTPTTKCKCKKPNYNFPDILSKPVDICGHCDKNCSGRGKVDEAIQCDLLGSCFMWRCQFRWL